MEEIAIAVKKRAAQLAPAMAREARMLRKRWPKLDFHEAEEGPYHFFIFSLPSDEMPLLKHVFSSLSAVMTDHIITKCQEDIVARLIEEQFYFLEPDIKIQLYAEFPQSAGETDGKCRRLVFFSLLHHFFSEGDLNLEGFINFRLREYWEELSQTL